MAFATSCSTTREPETEAGGEGKDEEAGGGGVFLLKGLQSGGSGRS